MRNFHKIAIVAFILVGGIACSTQQEDVVYEKFKTQLQQHGLTIDSVDQEGYLYIDVGAEKIKISLDNTRKNYQSDGDESHISDLVQVVLEPVHKSPSWDEGKANVFIYFYPKNDILENFVKHKITKDLYLIYVVHKAGTISWITKDDLNNWNFSEEELAQIADANGNTLIQNTTFVFESIEGKIFCTVKPIYESLTGAVLLSSDLKNKLNVELEYPICAIMPTRSKCYVFSKKDAVFFSNHLKVQIEHEFETEAYPVSKEVFMVPEGFLQLIK